MEGNTENSTVSQEKEETFGKDALLVAGAVLLTGLIIAGSIVSVTQKLAPTTTVQSAAKDAALQAPTVPTDTTAVISLDDDPILGDKNKAKIAIVEFSDYECPFCKQFHANTFDTLVKDFVDTGKALISFRDFPLSFHDPNATMEAATAECVRKEKGDKAYFAFGKLLYQNTQANGKGLVEGKLNQLIGQVGANVKTVTACAATDAVKQEIAKDIADGGKAGVTGTPSFVIGVLNADGTVTGERIVGAAPIDNFKTVIDKYLK
ncbi:MAG: DsbA family protein [Candidatus Moranbacteria bacterium]|nr:DsbA family protein [Candidatus Moranbacteria bacterium]